MDSTAADRWRLVNRVLPAAELTEQAMNRLLRATDDVQEGRNAFTERRDPRYQGR